MFFWNIEINFLIENHVLKAVSLISLKKMQNIIFM